MKLIERKKYLNTLIDVINTPDIKVITGVRRSGKSKLLDAFYDYLTTLNNVNIIRIKLNLKKYEKLLNPEELYKYIDKNYKEGAFDLSYANFATADEAYRTTVEGRNILKNDTLIHGDYCLPNFLMQDWNFSGFVDLGNGGVGDRHVDLFWGAWTLNFNLHTDEYRDLFFDAYGRDKINEDALLVVSAAEVFG